MASTKSKSGENHSLPQRIRKEELADYPSDPKKAHQPALILSTKAQAALYEGTSQQTSTEAREKFIDYLNQRINHGKPAAFSGDEDLRATNPETATISMDDLLGGHSFLFDGEGVRLYKAALAEEVHSKQYMDAFLENSTSHRTGPKWKKRPVVVVAGPSSSGKSFAAESALDQVDKDLEKDSNEDSGNHVITVDGGTARETSQMRRLLIQLAVKKGYSGIHDLHEKSSKTLETAKKRLLAAAKEEEHAGIVIPETFSNWATIQSFFSSLISLPDSQLFFTRVEGEDPELFRNVVGVLGSRRAYKTDFSDAEETDEFIKLNSTAIDLPESKEYEAQYFTAGLLGSKLAESYYGFLMQTLNRELYSYIIVNDLILITEDTGSSTGWKRLQNRPEPGVAVKCISRRTYENWTLASAKGDQRTLEQFRSDQPKQPAMIYVSLWNDVRAAVLDFQRKLTDKDIIFGIAHVEKQMASTSYLQIHEEIEKLEKNDPTANFAHLKMMASNLSQQPMPHECEQAAKNIVSALDKIEFFNGRLGIKDIDKRLNEQITALNHASEKTFFQKYPEVKIALLIFFASLLILGAITAFVAVVFATQGAAVAPVLLSLFTFGGALPSIGYGISILAAGFMVFFGAITGALEYESRRQQALETQEMLTDLMGEFENKYGIVDAESQLADKLQNIGQMLSNLESQHLINNDSPTESTSSPERTESTSASDDDDSENTHSLKDKKSKQPSLLKVPSFFNSYDDEDLAKEYEKEVRGTRLVSLKGC